MSARWRPWPYTGNLSLRQSTSIGSRAMASITATWWCSPIASPMHLFSAARHYSALVWSPSQPISSVRKSRELARSTCNMRPACRCTSWKLPLWLREACGTVWNINTPSTITQSTQAKRMQAASWTVSITGSWRDHRSLKFLLSGNHIRAILKQSSKTMLSCRPCRESSSFMKFACAFLSRSASRPSLILRSKFSLQTSTRC